MMQALQNWLAQLEQGGNLPWLVLISLCLVSFMLGWLLAKMRATRRIALLEAMLEQEVKSSEERIAALQESFSALSAEALRDNSRSFLQLANEVLGRHYARADHGLQERQSAIDHLVQPLQEALKATHQQLGSLEKSSRQTQGELTGQIRAMSSAQAILHQETRHLAHALRRPEVRGQWGELTLKRLLELSGMNAHADFTEQVSSRTGEGLIRPDMIVHLPGGGQVVIDVKTPLDAYLDAHGSEDQAVRERKLDQHAAQVKKRVRELAQKAYWAQFEQAPDFIVLFVPGDQFLAAALERDGELLEYSLEKRVVLATPTSLVALLRVIAYGWRQSELDEQTKVVRELAGEFDRRLGVFSRHLADLGRDLDRTLATYNRAVGSYRRKIRPISRKFEKFNPDIERVELAEREREEKISPASEDDTRPG